MLFPSIKNDSRRKIWATEETSVTGVFRGEVHEYKVHWVEKQKRTCVGQHAGCLYCESGVRPVFQFSVNFVNKAADGNLQSSVYESGFDSYKALSRLNEESPLEKVMVKISKVKVEGTKFLNDKFEKTKDLSPEMIRLVQNVELYDLQDSPSPYANQPSSQIEDDIGF